jgi:hypothetical protein
MMNKSILGAAALALSIGMAAAPLTVSAQTPEYMPSFFKVDKDGMMSKKDFLDAMGKKYDESMAKMKSMSPADQAKMMKGDKLTEAGARQLWRDMVGGS